MTEPERLPLFATQLRWTRASYVLVSTFVLTLFILAYVWWPLADEYLSQIDRSRPLWGQLDWLLIGIFLLMSTLIMIGADLKVDLVIIAVGLLGGLVIESWGTQTELWTYYTAERPPLWIIPAWPIASLSIDRLVRILHRLTPSERQSLYRALYWLVFPAFIGLMLVFVWPTRDKSFTVLSVILCIILTVTPTNYRVAVLTFAAGTGLGYFLERWGTTRLCWTYYTEQTPPLFAVVAHGMAAVAFWRAGLLLALMYSSLKSRLIVSRPEMLRPFSRNSK